MTPPIQKFPPPSDASRARRQVFNEQIKEELLLKLPEIKNRQFSLQGLLLGGSPVASQPLVCLKSASRPDLIAEYQGTDTCGYPQAKQAQAIALQSYQDECVIPVQKLEQRIREKIQAKQELDTEEKNFLAAKRRFVPVDMFTVRKIHPLADHDFTPQGNGLFRFEESNCEAAQYSIPVVLGEFGLQNPEGTHPLFNIVQHLSIDQLHDFRSGASMLHAAFNMEYGLLAAKQRSLTIAYPASSSHLAPLVIPFQLIDDQVIDEAKLIFTEIDTHSEKRIDAYLKTLATLPLNPADPANSAKLITDLKKQSVAQQPGSEVVFQFKYRDKPVTLTVALNRNPDNYIDDSYLENSDLILFHDLNEDKEATRITQQAESFRKANRPNAPLWILSDHDLDVFRGLGKEMGFDGRYGCGRVEDSGRFFADKTWSFLSDKSGETLIQGARSVLDPFGMKSDFHPIQVHLRQGSFPVHMIQVGGKTGPYAPLGI